MSNANAIHGASQFVSPSDIWGAHHRLALLTHPDKEERAASRLRELKLATLKILIFKDGKDGLPLRTIT